MEPHKLVKLPGYGWSLVVDWNKLHQRGLVIPLDEMWQYMVTHGVAYKPDDVKAAIELRGPGYSEDPT